MENTSVIVLGKRQYNKVIKWRIIQKYQVYPLGGMKFPLYVSLGEKLSHTAVGYEHIYRKDDKLINFNQFLKLIKDAK